MALSGWDSIKMYNLSIDKDLVDEPLQNFPVLLNITSSGGKNGFDLSNVFSELEYQFITESFTGASGSVPNVDHWYKNVELFTSADEASTTIQNNALNITSTVDSLNRGNIYSKFEFSGDFDVYVNVPDCSSVTSTTAANMYMWNDIDNRAYIGINGATWYCNSRISGTWDTEVSTSRAQDFGSLRLIRNNSYVTCKYKDGYSDWNTLQTFNCTTENCAIVLYAEFETLSDYVDFDDFIVGSGTLIWPNNTFPNRKKIALEYLGYDDYYIEDINDNFDGVSVNTYLWSEEGSSNSTITQSGTLNLYLDNTSTGYVKVYSNYVLQGSFDIQVDMSLIDAGTTASWTAGLYFKDNNTEDDSVFIFLRHNGSDKYYSANCQTAGSWQTEQTASTTDTNAKLRITRFDSNIRAFYKSGTAWINLGSWSSATTEDIVVQLYLDTVTNAQITEIAFDNLICKSDTVSWGTNTPRTVLKKAPINQQCYMEIENWDQLNNSAKIWAKIPEIASTKETKLQLYYDRNAPTTRSGISYEFDLVDWSSCLDLWRDSYNTGTATISGSSVTLDCKASGYNEVANLVSNFGLSGDFDIQVDASSLDTSRHAAIYFWYDVDNRGYINFNREELQCVANSRIDGSWDTSTQVSFTNTYGSLRLVRVGSLVYFKYRDGSGSWTDLTTYTAITSEIMVVLHGNINNSTMSTSGCIFSNFTINSADSISGYIGNASSIPGRSIWHHNFMAVYHMAQDPSNGTDSIIDSTIGNRHATPVGTWSPLNLIDGQTTKALYFAGLDQYLELDELAADLVDKSITVDVSVLSDVTQPSSVNLRLFSINTDTGGNSILMTANTTIDTYTIYDTVESWDATTGILNYINGNNVTYSYSIDTDVIEMFVDGMEDEGGEVPAVAAHITVSDTDLVSIGQEFDSGPTAGEFFAGEIQEVRVSDKIRSDAWRHATALSLSDALITFDYPVLLYFTNASPNNIVDYGFTSPLNITVTISGPHPSYMYDLTFYTFDNFQIGSTVYGTQNGQSATSILATPSGIEYSWYVTAVSSGVSNTSSIYAFDNRFLAEGVVYTENTETSGILVRLYRRSNGDLVNSIYSTASGTFSIETPYTDEHYCIALHNEAYYNALIYDRLTPSGV